MSHEIPMIMLPPAESIQELMPEPPVPQPAHTLATPTPEQARAVEAVFAQQQQENTTAANLLGLYTSGVMFHNLMTDSLTPSAEEVKKMPKLKVEEDERDE
ncbi:MAG TPA: hypothetical protein VKE94_22455 [Gemmataceae bacterium]|nr:hypothetical protein [Gemmataceae bacterium]